MANSPAPGHGQSEVGTQNRARVTPDKGKQAGRGGGPSGAWPGLGLGGAVIVVSVALALSALGVPVAASPGPPQELKAGLLSVLGLAPGGSMDVSCAWLQGQHCDGQSPAPSACFPNVLGDLLELLKPGVWGPKLSHPWGQVAGKACAGSGALGPSKWLRGLPIGQLQVWMVAQ